MKALDKVYVSIGPRQSLIAKAGKTLNSDIEYIRKDALLEWAKEKDLSSVLHHPDRHYILIELIDKLNSM